MPHTYTHTHMTGKDHKHCGKQGFYGGCSRAAVDLLRLCHEVRAAHPKGTYLTFLWQGNGSAETCLIARHVLGWLPSTRTEAILQRLAEFESYPHCPFLSISKLQASKCYFSKVSLN